MGKKNREEMALHEQKFVGGAVAKNIDQKKAKEIFNLMAQFADYGFNRSHSVAYAYLAYQTAYLKAHFAAYFYAAVLSNESDDVAKIYKYSNELRSGGLKLLPPDINESDADFTPLDNNVRFGLNAIKGIGSSSVQAIINARKNNKFTSLYDFTSRLDQGSIGRRGLESLITAGAFDSLMPVETNIHLWRAQLFAGIEGALSHGLKLWNDNMRGQNALFRVQDSTETILQQKLPDVRPWTQSELSQQEKAAVGFYLSTHPLDVFAEILKELKILNIADHIQLKAGDKITIAGIVSGFQVRHSKKGNRFCLFRFEDQSVGVKCLAWSDVFSKSSECLKDEELLIISGKVESCEGQEITLIVEEAKKIADAVPLKARGVSIILPEDNCDENFLEDLFGLLSSQRGNCEVFLSIKLVQKVLLKIHSQPLRVQGSSRLERDLRQKGCQVLWSL
jgi:DNA polymerase-3 subunit alpha